MGLVSIAFPAIDPVALRLGPLAVRWYGLAYMAGLLIGWQYVKQLVSTATLWPTAEMPFPPEKADELLLFMTLGVVVGGRLGEVLFYNPRYYLANPLEIPAVWHGGMSFHGGLVGSIIAIVLFARHHGASAWTVLDVAAAATPIGLFFGRLANFINGELWGHPSDLPWAMVFPAAGAEPRHPSQLYEAMLEGIFLFVLLWWLVHRRQALHRPGLIAGTFMVGYGLVRSLCEFFREPEFGHALNFGPLTAGMVYSLPMVVVGGWRIWIACTKVAAKDPT
jgi:phosphatidylglycerol---prolipoprotein diacylglyceryl transferase